MKKYIFFVIVIFFLIYLYINNYENFENIEEFGNYLDNNKLYDDFYTKIYDELFYSKAKNYFEINDLITNGIDEWPGFKKSIKILDLGCGTGKHARLLDKNGYKVVGIDNSKTMINYAKQKYNKNNTLYPKFLYGDMMEYKLFNPKIYTHVTCYFFTVYYIKNHTKLFNNVNYWLKDNGFFSVHLVNPEKFDPILDKASPFPLFSLQRYSKKRVTKTDLEFNNFHYNANFEQDGNLSSLSEVFTWKNENKKRKQKHQFYMPELKQMKNNIKNAGFKLTKITDLTPVGFEYQYIYHFQKI